MGKLKQFLNLDETIELKAKKVYENILTDFRNNKINTETELLYRIKNDLNNFYESIDKPEFKPYYAKGTPKSKDYNNMIESLVNDFWTCINNCKMLDESVTSSFIIADIDERALSSSLKIANKILIDLKESIYSFINSNAVNFTDSFEKQNNSLNSNANIDTENCILTLPLEKSTNNTSGMKVEVISSNGLPGNSHIVENTRLGLSFVGQGNLRNDVSVISDKNKDSWFEYELFNVKDEIYNKCNTMGFDYREGISWVTNDKELNLVFKITPTNYNVNCNWFSITPYLPASKSYKPAIIEKIILSDGQSNIKYIPVNKAFDEPIIVTFEEQKIKTIEVYLKQPNVYQVDVGHIYSVKLTNKMSIYDEIVDNIYNRVDFYKPSVNALGVSYDPKEEKVIHSKTEENYNYNHNELFALPMVEGNYSHGVEVLNVDRYMIGVRDVALSRQEFKEYGTYISQDFESENEITSITLNSKETVPIYNSEEELYIKYFLTFDDGIVWHEIFPKEKAYLGPCTIKINSDESPFERERTDKIKYIDRLLETKKFKIKIELKKPKDSLYTTPIVYSYRLDVKTGDDEFDN